jgi:thiamine pyrophosphate-dependent acetolactate synthase large subunit-like protein
MPHRTRSPFGVDFKNPNFARVAEAMGAKGIRIEEPGEVREGLAVALAHQGGPVVVDVIPTHCRFHRIFPSMRSKASPSASQNS